MIDGGNLVKKPENKPNSYAQGVIQGLKYIHDTPQANRLDRHVLMAIPNSLALTKGTSAHKFLASAGELSRKPQSGVKVTLERGHSFQNRETGEEETILLIDFEYTSAINFEILEATLES